MVNSGKKSASAAASGRTSSVRMNSECHANSVMTRTLTRYSGCEPPNRSWTNSVSLAASAVAKSALIVANCSGVIGLLVLPYQITGPVT